MKQFTLILCSFLFIMSCAPTKTEIWMNKNGSGKFQSDFDLGEMASMMTTMVESMDESEEETDEESGGGIWGDTSDEPEKMDTVMNFYEIAPDSVKERVMYPEIMKRFELRMKIDEEKEEGIMSIHFDYDDSSDMEKLMEDFAQMQSSEYAAMGGGQDVGMLFTQYDADLKQGIVRMPRSDMLAELMAEEEDDIEFKNMIDSIQYLAPDDDRFFMLEMLLGKGSETVIHCPGPVEFTNDPNAKIDGNTVTFIDNPLEELKKGRKPATGDRIIKFKKK